MRILVAPDCFTGTLTAAEAADAMAEGWARGAPHDHVTTLPLADGGPGFLDAVRSGLLRSGRPAASAAGGQDPSRDDGIQLVAVTVRGPLGVPTPAVVLMVSTASGPVAYLESAQAVGLHLVAPDQRDPTRTTSAGVGQLIRAALQLGARRIVLGLGGSATNDGGAGMLAALGAGAADGDLAAAPADGLLTRGGGGLTEVEAAHLVGLRGVRRALAGVDLVGAADVDVPLLGLHGASAGFAAQKGATAEQAQHLERALGRFCHVVGQVVDGDEVRRDLLGGEGRGPQGRAARGLAQLAGSGAAGGLGFAVAALGGRLLPGADVVADAVGLAERVAESDLVVTGEGSFDWQSLHGKVVSAVARHGLGHGVPVVVVAGRVLVGRREWGAAGIAGAYPVADRPEAVVMALADPAGTLVERVERVARTWSR